MSCTYTSLLQASRATMFLDGIREVELQLSSFSVPAVTLGTAIQPTAFLDIPHPASQMTFTPLHISFRVEDNLRNYLAVHNWLVNIGSPFNRQQYESLGENVHRDLIIFFYDSLHNKIAEVKFINSFPIELGEIRMGFEETIPEPIHVPASFSYERFVITEGN